MQSTIYRILVAAGYFIPLLFATSSFGEEPSPDSATVGNALFSQDCERLWPFYSTASPSNKKVAQIVSLDCGNTTTQTHYEVTVTEPGVYFPSRFPLVEPEYVTARVFSAVKLTGIALSWDSDSKLIIYYSGERARIIGQKDHLGAISIVLKRLDQRQDK